jgi:hypothetical protein
LTGTSLFAITEVKSLPSGKGTYSLITANAILVCVNIITGGFHAQNSMPLR